MVATTSQRHLEPLINKGTLTRRQIRTLRARNQLVILGNAVKNSWPSLAQSETLRKQEVLIEVGESAQGHWLLVSSACCSRSLNAPFQHYGSCVLFPMCAWNFGVSLEGLELALTYAPDGSMRVSSALSTGNEIDNLVSGRSGRNGFWWKRVWGRSGW